MTNKKAMNKASTNLAIKTLDNLDYGLDLVNDRDGAVQFFTDLLKGRTSGVTSPNEAMMVYGRCRELNLPFMATLDHMCVIGGKVCADIHIKTALALRAGNSLWWEKIRDYEPQYKYTDGVNEWVSSLKPIKFLEELKKEDPIGETLQYAWDAESTKKAVDAGKKPFGNAIKHNVAFDYVTEYKFFRVRRLANGEEKTIEALGKFSSLEGHTAQLGYGSARSDYAGQRDPNSNWGKYEPRMVDVRAFDNGLKNIASDLTMGMPEIGEMAEVHNLQYKVDNATGNATVQSNIEDVEAIEEQ